MDVIALLNELRSFGGDIVTHGLADDVVARFASLDPKLQQAIEEAVLTHRRLSKEFPELLTRNEMDLVHCIQQDFVNFYHDDVVNPYVPIAACGPWIITSKGAVIHDSGGYGMLGFGHSPEVILQAMDKQQVMANVMTPSFSQLRLISALQREIGQTRGGCPYDKFLFMNSGSEAVTVAARISDVNAKLMTDPEGRYAGCKIKKLVLSGGFHGRTDRPARYSDSTRKTYRQYLASFRDLDDLIVIAPNDLEGLKAAYAGADSENVFIETMFMEPVMGEGNPGMAMTPEFYRLARKLTREHGSLLLMDAIQAGLRATGYLSIVDYPGFEKLDPPDMETYSKALNAGQYPLSVLAMTGHAAGLYRKGIYGNTMTANPRAMDVGYAVLHAVTPDLRANIRERGNEFLDKLHVMAGQLGGRITKVQGTGLLFSCELDPSYKCYGFGSIEEYLRMHGIGVIHGGKNSLRYTPHFNITSEEVDLVIAQTRDALLNGPRQAHEEQRAAG